MGGVFPIACLQKLTPLFSTFMLGEPALAYVTKSSQTITKKSQWADFTYYESQIGGKMEGSLTGDGGDLGRWEDGFLNGRASPLTVEGKPSVISYRMVGESSGLFYAEN